MKIGLEFLNSPPFPPLYRFLQEKNIILSRLKFKGRSFQRHSLMKSLNLLWSRIKPYFLVKIDVDTDVDTDRFTSTDQNLLYG